MTLFRKIPWHLEKEAPPAKQAAPEKLYSGIPIGTWAPRDRDGKSLGKIFNVFAAPQDLTDEAGAEKVLMTFDDAARRVASLKDWHGFDGADFEDDRALYKALKDGSYDGTWFIPPLELLNGKTPDNEDIQPDHLYGRRDQGNLKDTFTTAADESFGSWYWSCTVHHAAASEVYGVDFSDGVSNWLDRAFQSQSVRLVRLEPK